MSEQKVVGAFFIFVVLIGLMFVINWRRGKDRRDAAARDKDFCVQLLKTMDSRADSAAITKTWFCERPKP